MPLRGPLQLCDAALVAPFMVVSCLLSPCCRTAVNSVFVYSSRATLVVVFLLVFLLVFCRVENSCGLRFRLFFEYRGLEVDIKQDMNSLVMASLCG